ncbi:cupin domain-containing protein [Phenylobacterium terrae]
MQDSIIAYGVDGRASLVEQPLETLEESAFSHLVGVIEFTDDESVHADHWEIHPGGDEILYVLEGRLLAVIEHDGRPEEAVIAAGQGFVMPRASWHRLKVLEPGRLLFFTPTQGIALRPVAPDAVRHGSPATA